MQDRRSNQVVHLDTCSVFEARERAGRVPTTRVWYHRSGSEEALATVAVGGGE